MPNMIADMQDYESARAALALMRERWIRRRCAYFRAMADEK